jgi:pantetheine-phosphate adenylyltransferase
MARRRDLERLLRKWGVLSRARIVTLTDRYGPTSRDPEIQALVVSKHTAKTAYEINKRRRSKGLRALKIILIDLILAQDKHIISSTRIRRGRIDREGRIIP